MEEKKYKCCMLYLFLVFSTMMNLNSTLLVLEHSILITVEIIIWNKKINFKNFK